MIDKIKQLLIENKDIDGYKIAETKIESNELFFLKKSIDMDRAKNVHHFKVTVYKDFEEDGTKFKGSSTASIHPTMNDEEIKNALNDAAFAAKFVKNPYYPLVKPSNSNIKLEESEFSKGSLPFWMGEITNALYAPDNYDKGGINSCEIFLDKIYTRIVNSEGVDISNTRYKVMTEFITTWKEDGEEVELYRCLNFSDFDSEEISGEVNSMINISKEKAVAKNTPALGKASVLLTKGAVKDFFSFYDTLSSASAVYQGYSTWKIGQKLQGEEVKGDTVTMILNPFMKNSTNSSCYDDDGFPLAPVPIIEDGILQRYSSNTRFAHYLNIEPTGTINNISVSGGTKTEEELKKDPFMEVVAFSDFSVDDLTGDFCGEIRLAWYFDGDKKSPVTGGSISGNINEVHNEMFLSKEIQKDNNFEGPKVIKLLNVNVAGVE
ncbi:metallopeptidase TldD-related protein [Oceanirhabdus sp. W0125-5]|uniref:metallopeptidase TldD-related protein n=1 Tax=Oceanirhabdus sp. W0125-5 TaxID=2999116 RepID=UPI0022F2C5E9|nr:metallopeptidase TldD-related protein [Oceanirhabdus sp. W0125-5]WBW95622.1 metallopeptidase TldD-related protein [Oceanirhabdus sp. W0125-5]